MKIGIISTGGAGKIANYPDIPLEELYNSAGYNTGNFAFWGGLSKSIADEQFFLPWDFNPYEVKEVYDALVFPAANQLSSTVDLGFMADRFELADLPVVVVGLGSQSHETHAAIELTAGTQRWLSVMAERTSSIGVRGERSEDILRRYGIHNVEVVGCPSLFINESSSLGREIEQRFNSGVDNLVICQGEMSHHAEEIEKNAFNFALKNDFPYICQAPDIVLSLATGKDSHLTLEDLRNIINFYCPSLSLQDLLSFAKKNMKAFFDYEDWMNFLKNYDFSIGSRLHGNFLALQAGIPAMVICQDGRMSELANTIKCPMANRSLFKKEWTIADIKNEFIFDGSSFDENRAKLSSSYINIIERVGIKLSQYMKNISTY